MMADIRRLNHWQLHRRIGQMLVILLLGGLLLSSARTAAAQAIPTFTITAVDKDKTVTIETRNFPPNQKFTVTMGQMGTRGVNGFVAGTYDSGAGGRQTATFTIPAQLKGHARIAIRLQTAHLNPYFAFNWFHNASTSGGQTGDPPPTQPPPAPGYSGIPTFLVTAVKKGQTVTITTKNFPANQNFAVTMGAFSTRGVNGVSAGSWNSGQGGTQSVVFNIPAQVSGHGRIAIRLQTAHANPFFAYNWFYNASTP